MRSLLVVLLMFVGLAGFAQQDGEKPKERQSLLKTDEQKAKEAAQKAPITSYRIITLQRDTTYVDTTLSIKKAYAYNYLRTDDFGLLPFLNEGQSYNVLDYGRRKFSPYPEFGYRAKHMNYLEVDDIRYYSVATPFTELYFKTVMQQGQSVDALVTVNTSEQFNFSVAYKGLRSLGKYINQLSSNGNFRFTASYKTKSQRYVVNSHFAGQDLMNQENGGITTPIDFESKDPDFKERQRMEVYLKDAQSFLKGNRWFVDHAFRINPTQGSNNLYLTHQFNYERKYFEYNQATIPSTVGTATVNRFGTTSSGGINDQVRYSKMYNKIGAIYENSTLGRFQFFIDDFQYQYFYNSVFIKPDGVVPGKITDQINSFGGQYEYRKGQWNGTLLYSNSITNQSLTNIEAKAAYAFNDRNKVTFGYQRMNKLPDVLYNLHQSSYDAYLWSNNFKNEKINSLTAEATTQWANLSFQLSNYNDMLYFGDNSSNDTIQLIAPKQYGKSIQYLSLKASKEIKFWKLALDNTVLYQKVAQDDNVLNVPELVTRNTLYFSDRLFKKALFLQTGLTFNYFTSYYANGYNPVIGDFYVQDKQKIGAFPMLDFFVNAQVRTARIYLKAEHFNAAFSSPSKFYTAPGYPYRDFIIRFGLEWNFFK